MTDSPTPPSCFDMTVPRERLHRFLRAVFTHYPVRFGAAWLNRRLDRFFIGSPNQWLLAPGRGTWPTMELDLSKSLQRKFFYFPNVYGRFYGHTVFRDYLAATLSPGSTFIDIGANVGFFSLLAAPLVGPTGHIYAFEPDPDICQCLVRSGRANGHTQLEAFQLALSDRDGELAFYRAHDGTASSLVPEAPGHEDRYDAVPLKTRVTTLDHIVQHRALPLDNIALIKVDVEGEEARTVAGMLFTLARAGYPPIWCEVRGPEGSTRAPNTYQAVLEQLTPLGYRPLFWSNGETRPVADGEVRHRADVLFERPR